MIKLNQAVAVLESQQEQVRAAFTDRVAVDELVAATTDRATATGTGIETGFNLTALRELAARGMPPAQAFGGQAGAVPLGALRLYRAMLTRSAMASSWRVRAASTPSQDGGITRKVGPFDVSLIREPDLSFLVIGNVSQDAPHRMLLLAEDGDGETVALPTPVDGNIQLVLGNDDASQRIILLAGNVTTSVFLH